MTRRPPSSTGSLPLTSLLARAAVVAVVVGSVVAACGGGDAEVAVPQLSPAAEDGREIARSYGCMSCHSEDGRDGIGPSWAGLAGSEVELTDGTRVIADEEYLTTAIVDPNAQIVAGYRGIMPERQLDPDDVAAIVTYLQELGGVDP